MNQDDFLIDGVPDSRAVFVFAHGAGAPMDSPFMNEMARALADAGICVRRFEFPYMAARRDGARRGPDRMKVLLDSWHDAIRLARQHPRIYIGGKSMGGRIATMVADEDGVDGVICFGYPFHPPGRPEKLRTEHLRSIKTSALIIQGERDPFGSPDEVSDYSLARSIRVEWIPDGDHSFKPRKRSGHTLEDNLARASRLAIDFISQE